MSQTPSFFLRSTCLTGAALMVLLPICCTSVLAQKFAEQSGKKSYSKSYASSNSQYNGNSYAAGKGRGSSYSSATGSSNGPSYAQSFQSQTPSYVSSGSNGASYASSIGNSNSYARGSSYASSSKGVPYSQQIRLGKSTGGSILGIMHGAPAARTQTGYSSNVRPNSASLSRAPVETYNTSPTVSTTTTNNNKPAEVTAQKGPKKSIFSKLR